MKHLYYYYEWNWSAGFDTVKQLFGESIAVKYKKTIICLLSTHVYTYVFSKYKNVYL
jgi:hypothetical protein